MKHSEKMGGRTISISYGATPKDLTIYNWELKRSGDERGKGKLLQSQCNGEREEGERGSFIGSFTETG